MTAVAYHIILWMPEGTF